MRPLDNVKKRKLSKIIDLSKKDKKPAAEGELRPDGREEEPAPLEARARGATVAHGDLPLTGSTPSFLEKFEKEKEERGFIIGEDPADSGEAEPHFPRRLRGKTFGAVLGGFLAILVIFILLSTVFARVRVTVKPRLESVSLQDIPAALDVSVSRTLLQQKVLPAERLDFLQTITEEFDATGIMRFQEKARGKIKLYNGFSSSPQRLVENTRFISDAGVLFRLLRSITIPGAQIEEGKIVPNFIEVELAADAPGEKGNIGGLLMLKIPGFKGTPKYEGFYAETIAPFSGGFTGEARVVSKDDLKKAQELLTKKIHQELSREVRRKIPPEFILVDALQETQIVKINAPQELARRDRFSIEVNAGAHVLIFRPQDVTDLIKTLVVKDPARQELLEKSLEVTYRVREVDFNKGRAALTLKGEVKLKAVIPGSELASLIRGQKEGSLIEILRSRPEISAFRISFFPPWQFSAPNDIKKIRLIVEELSP